MIKGRALEAASIGGCSAALIEDATFNPETAAATVVELPLMYVAFEAGLRPGPCGMS